MLELILIAGIFNPLMATLKSRSNTLYSDTLAVNGWTASRGTGAIENTTESYKQIV